MTHRTDIDNLNRLFNQYGLEVNEVVDAPTVTTYKLKLDVDTKIKAVLRLEANVAIAVNDQNVRYYQDGNLLCIEKKAANSAVNLDDLCNTGYFSSDPSKLLMSIGVDTTGAKIYYDLRKAPHMIVAGTTGAGKSICLHSIACSLLMNHPKDINFIMIDMKGSEFIRYSLLDNVKYDSSVIDAMNSLKTLNWEMNKRYSELTRTGCRDIDAYNQTCGTMNRIVCIIDEFADLILKNKEVENLVVNIAQKSRACGIHLIIGTQSPRAEVVTGLIKANIPTRIGMMCTNVMESRIILDRKGADKLNGKGDMLFLPNGYKNPIRVQGCFVSDEVRDGVIIGTYLKQGHTLHTATKTH